MCVEVTIYDGNIIFINLIRIKNKIAGDIQEGSKSTVIDSLCQILMKLLILRSSRSIINKKGKRWDITMDNEREQAYHDMPEDVQEKLKSPNCTLEQKRYLRKMPWGQVSAPEIDLNFAKETLESSHFGMHDVKEQILRYIACQKHLGRSYGDVLLLVGPPGVGKTSIVKSIAKAMGRSFFKISLAGMSDAGPLRGYDTNYKSPKPGHIVEGIIHTGTFSPLILLDEIDKVSKESSNGDPAYVLLDILDSDRSNFVDDMLEVPIDLSNIVFVATANSLKEMSPILLNRFEIITLKGYSRDEKIKIANNYLIPALREEYKIESLNLEFTNELVEHIVDNLTNEPGIRSLRRFFKLTIESILTEKYLGNSISTRITIAEFNRLTKNRYEKDTSPKKQKKPTRRKRKVYNCD